jgi:hypothetical protein
VPKRAKIDLIFPGAHWLTLYEHPGLKPACQCLAVARAGRPGAIDIEPFQGW